MRLSKFLTIAFSITCFSLLYVYQQTEIFRLAYVGQNKLVVMEDLLDKNTNLRYNIDSNASLVHIGNKISASADFQMPDSYRFVRMVPAKGNLKLRAQAANKETLISRIFGVKRQAEAETIP